MYLYNFTENNLLFLSDKNVPTKEPQEKYFHYVVTPLQDKQYYEIYTSFIDGSITINEYDSYPEEDSMVIKHDLKLTLYKNITQYYNHISEGEFSLIHRKYIFSKEDVNKYNDLLSFYILYGMAYIAKNVYILPTVSSIINHHPSEFYTNNHPYTFEKNKNIIQSFGKNETLEARKLITEHFGLRTIFYDRYMTFLEHSSGDYTPEPEYDENSYTEERYKKMSSYLKHFFEIDSDNRYIRRYAILMLAEDLKNNPQVVSNYFIKNDDLDTVYCEYDKNICNIPEYVKKYYENGQSSLVRETIIRLYRQNLLDDVIKDINKSSIIAKKRGNFINELYYIFNRKKFDLKNKLKNYMSERWDYEILCDVFEGIDTKSIKELAFMYDIDTDLTRLQICTELSKILNRKKEEYKKIASNCANTDDPISGNEVADIDSREVITIEQSGKQFCFEIEGLYEYIKKDKLNPYTRQPFSDEQLETIKEEYFKLKKLKGRKFDADNYKYETSLHALIIKLINLLPYTSGTENFISANLQKIKKFVNLLNYAQINIKIDLNNPQVSLEMKKRTILESLIKYIGYGGAYWPIKIVWGKMFMNDREQFVPSIDDDLIKAINNEDLDSIRKLVEEGKEVNNVHPILGEPLYIAIKSKLLKIVKYLVEHGATIKYNYPEEVFVNKVMRDYLISKDIFTESDFLDTVEGYLL